MKLCLFKVAKLDVCIRPLFANPVTYYVIDIPHAWYMLDIATPVKSFEVYGFSGIEML